MGCHGSKKNKGEGQVAEQVCWFHEIGFEVEELKKHLNRNNELEGILPIDAGWPVGPAMMMIFSNLASVSLFYALQGHLPTGRTRVQFRKISALIATK
jgi:hypothetical protein